MGEFLVENLLGNDQVLEAYGVMRELDAAVTGVAVQDRDGGPRVLAASGRDLFAYAPDGEVRGRPIPAGMYFVRFTAHTGGDEVTANRQIALIR